MKVFIRTIFFLSVLSSSAFLARSSDTSLTSAQSPNQKQSGDMSTKELAANNLASFIFMSKVNGEAGVGYSDRKLIEAIKKKLNSDFLFFRGKNSVYILTDPQSIQSIVMLKTELDVAIKASMPSKADPTPRPFENQAMKRALDTWQRSVFAIIIDAMAKGDALPISKVLPPDA